MLIQPNKTSSQKEAKYVSLEANPSTEDLQNHFLKWIKDNSYIKKYEKVSLLKPGSVLIRLYRYEEKSKSILDTDGMPMTMVKLLPICKVIQVQDPETMRVKVGDLLSCPEDLRIIETSPVWLNWDARMRNEKPTPEGLIEPEKLIGRIFEWRKLSKFVIDKINPSEDDDYTFIRQESEFFAKYK